MNIVRVLLVVGEKRDVGCVERALQRAGYQPVCRRADNVSEFRAAMADGETHIVFVDYQHPNLPGSGVVSMFGAELKQKSIPIVILSHGIGELAAMHAIAAGATDCIHYDELEQITDLTRQRLHWAQQLQQRRKLEQQGRLFSRAIEQSPSMLVITDPEGSIEYINPKFSEVTGYSLTDVFGKNPRIWKSGDTSVDQYSQLWKTIRRGETWRGELRNKKKNGQSYWVYSAISSVKNADGEITHFFAINEDISRRKLAEEQIRDLNIQIQQVQERERAHLSRELHDGINQLLVGAHYRLQTALHMLKKSQPGCEQELEQADAIVQDAISEVRRISHFLAPRVLDDLGLFAAVRGLLQEFSQRLDIQVSSEGLEQLQACTAKNQQTALYRIFQEALTNIEKHAQAGEVRVQVKDDGDRLCIRIADNGRGGPAEEYRSHGIGLRNIQQRLEHMGGNFNIESAPDQGTVITLFAPLATQ